MSKNNDKSYTPISMWGYFWYQILFAIPFIGLVFLIIFALGAKNINLRNFARSYFCVLIIALVILAILFACGLGGAVIEAVRAAVFILPPCCV